MSSKKKNLAAIFETIDQNITYGDLQEFAKIIRAMFEVEQVITQRLTHKSTLSEVAESGCTTVLPHLRALAKGKGKQKGV